MNFIDRTGHIFSMMSHESYPTGYEYETFDYVFYLEDEYAGRLSVNNYYIKPIRVLLDKPYDDISIKIDSTVFKLIGSKTIQDQIHTTGSFNIEFDEDDKAFKKELTNDDICVITDDNNILVPFYVIGITSQPATWTSNILITVNYSDGTIEYCPITVGGVFYDEQEELIINGCNMGVYLPKDIIKAVYGTSIYNNVINEALYNSKVKEYLMNYMRLHGEVGNIDSMLSGLKFFGWGDKINIVQLVKTDNEVISQYIRDFLNTNNDLLERFDHFSRSGLISLYVSLNGETGEYNKPDYNNDFWGEMKPILEDYTNKLVNIKYDEQDIVYQKPYFDYVLTELMLKVSCLRYYYQKYFLPMHVLCMSASVNTLVHANDIKYFAKAFPKVTEMPEMFEMDRTIFSVEFPDSNTLYAYTQEHYVDGNYNEFARYIPLDKTTELDTSEDIYYINDICISIPIKFSGNKNVGIYNCHLILERYDGTIMYESDFLFSDKDEYRDFVIHPKTMNDGIKISNWIDKCYCIHLLVNGVWFKYNFEMKVPELQLQFGKLQYKYDNSLFRQINSIGAEVDFQTFMYMPSLIDVQNINFPRNVIDYYNDDVMRKFIDMYHESPSIPSISESGTIAKKYYNRVHYYELRDSNGNEIEYKPYKPTKEEAEKHNGIFPDNFAEKQSPETIALYKEFFNDDGTQKNEYIIGNMSYDIYLMHDSLNVEDYLPQYMDLGWTPKWYLVLISRNTIDVASTEKELDAPNIILDDIKAIYMKSDNKWLINRMEYIATNGINHFSPTDIIVGTINNIELPFILETGTKWDIMPYSLGMQSDSKVSSTTNTFLMSLGNDNTGYDKGYYNIVVHYSLDGMTQNKIENKAKILVK